MRVEASGLALARGGRTVLAGLTFVLAPGTVTLVAGPNGAGKSTLLSALAGDLAPAAGVIRMDGLAPARVPLARRARLRAVLPQRPSVAFAFRVRDLVAMGLHPHGLAAGHPPGADIVERALSALDLAGLADRPVPALSGGEESRAHIARVFAQVEGALAGGLRPLLLLDEPTAGLDYRHQFALADRLRALARRGVTVAVSLHDLPLGRRLADRVLLLSGGRLAATGPPDVVLAPGEIARVFGLGPEEAARLAA